MSGQAQPPGRSWMFYWEGSRVSGLSGLPPSGLEDKVVSRVTGC